MSRRIFRRGSRASGSRAGDAEMLMIHDTESFSPQVRSSIRGIEIRRICDAAAIQAIADLQERNWGRSLPWLPDLLHSLWDHAAFYGAYAGGGALGQGRAHEQDSAHARDGLVGAGWIEYPSGSPFAEIHGGAVLPEWRGRGIYSRLLDARMADALERRVPWITVDAAPMSRPILEAKGFMRLDETCPMTWAPSRAMPEVG